MLSGRYKVQKLLGSPRTFDSLSEENVGVLSGVKNVKAATFKVLLRLYILILIFSTLNEDLDDLSLIDYERVLADLYLSEVFFPRCSHVYGCTPGLEPWVVFIFSVTE